LVRLAKLCVIARAFHGNLTIVRSYGCNREKERRCQGGDGIDSARYDAGCRHRLDC